ncbi:unnamed protein product [Lota lota]
MTWQTADPIGTDASAAPPPNNTDPAELPGWHRKTNHKLTSLVHIHSLTYWPPEHSAACLQTTRKPFGISPGVDQIVGYGFSA